jgi:hypothetical protein
MADIKRRVRRARKTVVRASLPAGGGGGACMDRASELVAIEDSQKRTTKPLVPGEHAGIDGEQIATPVGPEGEPVEPIEAVRMASILAAMEAASCVGEGTGST